MGCGQSKEEDPNEIKYEMKETKIPSYDDVIFLNFLFKRSFSYSKKWVEF